MIAEHEKVLDWITKDYESYEYWKTLGREIFLVANGDSVLARHRLADTLRRSISRQTPPKPVEIQRWNDDFTCVVTIEVEPPGISTSSEVYVDWVYIADYVLLAAASTWERFDEESQRRKELYDRARRGYEARQIVREVKEYRDTHPQASDDDVMQAMARNKLEVKQVHLTNAKRMCKRGPDEPQDYDEKEPVPPTMLKTYENVYF